MHSTNTTLDTHFSQNMPPITDKYEYVDEDLINDELKCIICTQPFQSPVIITCKHSFCLSCIDTWFRQNASCPICRHPLERQFPLNKLTSEILLTQLDSLPVRCLKCHKTNIKRMDIETHLKRCSKLSNPFGKPWRSIKMAFRKKPQIRTITSNDSIPFRRYSQTPTQEYFHSYTTIPTQNSRNVTTGVTASFQPNLLPHISAFINTTKLTILVGLIMFLVLFLIGLSVLVLIICFLVHFVSKLLRKI